MIWTVGDVMIHGFFYTEEAALEYARQHGIAPCEVRPQPRSEAITRVE